MTFNLSDIEADVNLAEQVAKNLAPFLFLIPGIAPYAAAIGAAIPQIIKATNVLEGAGAGAVGTTENTQAIADHLNPEQPANPVLNTPAP